MSLNIYSYISFFVICLSFITVVDGFSLPTPNKNNNNKIFDTSSHSSSNDDDNNNNNNNNKKSKEDIISRRGLLFTGATVTATAASNILLPSSDSNIASASPPLIIPDDEKNKGPPERQILLEKILSSSSSSSKTSNDEKEIIDIISKLEALDPSNGKGAISSKLDGTWELIYSINAQAFSPLLNLPQPIRPTSIQLLGDDAAKVVGGGRVAQVLNFPIIPLSIILSSGTIPVGDNNPSILEIFPPFRLEIKLGNNIKKQIVEAGSDAEFRALNARDDEAQAAPRNMYKQRYLETTGLTGDIRISEVISGDPVIVGAVFVHRRL